MIPGEPLTHLVIEAFAACLGIRNEDLGNDLARLENIFMLEIDLRQNEKLFQRDHSLTPRVGDPDLRVESDERRGGVRRMNDIARPRAENRMITAIARHGIADLPAFSETIETRRAKVPTERPLADVAADGAGVADLRRRRFRRRV